MAIIGARSGSKRLPHKNILDFCGRPLIEWSIDAALQCDEISRTIVSTDASDYQEIALRAGAECPRLRKAHLASDAASSSEMVLDVLDNFLDDVSSFDAFVLLQVTSPLRNHIHISEAIQLHRASGAPGVVSVSEAETPPQWIGKLGADNSMNWFVHDNSRNKRSQDLGDWYRLNGAIYVLDIKTFQKTKNFIPEGAIAYIMSREHSIDIDTQVDFEIAEILQQRELNRG